MIPIEQIDVDDKWNIRGKFNSASVADLQSMIEKQGLLQPICVRHNPNLLDTAKPYSLVYGFRRFKAMQGLAWTEVPAMIKNLTEEEAINQNLVENLARKDLTITQEARAVDRLQEMGRGASQIANILGQSIAWVDNRIKLLALPKLIQENCETYMFTATQIRNLYNVRTNNEKLFRLTKMYKENKQSAGKYDKKDLRMIEKSDKQRQRAPLKNLKPDKETVQNMINYIADQVGHNIASTVLVWTLGDLSEMELHMELKKKFENYVIPEYVNEAIK